MVGAKEREKQGTWLKGQWGGCHTRAEQLVSQQGPWLEGRGGGHTRAGQLIGQWGP